MNIIKIKLGNVDSGIRGDTAMQMSKWCKDRELKFGTDYNYEIISQYSEIHYQFFGEAKQIESMFILKWQYENQL